MIRATPEEMAEKIVRNHGRGRDYSLSVFGERVQNGSADSYRILRNELAELIRESRREGAEDALAALPRTADLDF